MALRVVVPVGSGNGDSPSHEETLMAITLLQDEFAINAFDDHVDVTMPGATTTGSLLVAVVSTNGNTTFSSITDTYSNTWHSLTLITATSFYRARLQIWYADNITGGANHSVTCTKAAGSSATSIALSEWSGADNTANPFKRKTAPAITVCRRLTMPPLDL